MEFQWSPGGHFLVKQGIYQENVSGDIPLAYPLTQIAHLDDDDQNPQKIADIYISISTGTFDIENIKYEKKWQQLDLDFLY